MSLSVSIFSILNNLKDIAARGRASFPYTVWPYHMVLDVILVTPSRKKSLNQIFFSQSKGTFTVIA